MKERKRKITVITIIGIMLILAITTFTYAIWSRTHTQTGINKNTYACFDISYEETNGTGITMENGFPQKDEEGLKNNPYEVQITNKCDTVSTYNVILNKQQGSDLKDEHLKVAVDNDYKLLSQATPTDKRTIQDFSNEASYIIGTGVVGPKQTKIVQIRSWMDKDTTEDEGENKTFTYKITIENAAGVGDLKTKIFGKEYAVITETPDFSKGFPNSSTSEEETKSKSGLYLAFDDDGSSYYFRGNVENNYVQLGQANGKDLIWRIVRINGDGTVRIILDDRIDTGGQVYNSMSEGHQYAGFTYENTPCTKSDPCVTNYASGTFTNTHGGTNSPIKSKLEEWYNTNLKDYDDKIALTTFCNDTSYGSGTEDSSNYLYYGSRYRVETTKQPDLHCPDPTKQDGRTNRDYGGVYKLKIGLINGDELAMGGYSWSSPYATTDNYLRRSYIYWAMSPSSADTSYAGVLNADRGGSLSDNTVDNTFGVLPVINLKADTLITSGDGSESQPFVVE